MSNLAQQVNTLALRVKSLFSNINQLVVDGFDSNSPILAASAKSAKTLFELLATKLDRSEYNDHYKGTYTTLNQLQAVNMIANAGDYALVDAGIGQDTHIYIWDTQEGWVQGGATSLLNTDALPEGNTRLYFRNDRVKQAFNREDATFAAASLANNAVATNTVNIATRYQLLHITTSHPCRVRLYTSAAQRDADLTRPIGTDPIGNHGLLFEFISTSGLLSSDLSPLVDGFAVDLAISYSITNLSGTAQTISVTLNHVKTGA